MEFAAVSIFFNTSITNQGNVYLPNRNLHFPAGKIMDKCKPVTGKKCIFESILKKYLYLLPF